MLLLIYVEVCSSMHNVGTVNYDGPNGSFFYFDTNSQFRIPNSEIRIPNSAVRKKVVDGNLVFWRCHIRVRARGGARDPKLEQFKQKYSLIYMSFYEFVS